MNSGTPSVLATISSTSLAGNRLRSSSCRTMAAECGRSRRSRCIALTCGRTGPSISRRGPRGDDGKDRDVSDVICQQVEEFHRRRIDPMRVLEQHEHRRLLRQPAQSFKQRVERLRPSIALGQCAVVGSGRSPAPRAGQRRAKAFRHHGSRTSPIALPACPASARTCRVLRELGRSLELLDERIAAHCWCGRESIDTGAGYTARRQCARPGSRASRDLPMPASPESSTTWPSPLRALPGAKQPLDFASRPTNGVRRLAACRVEAASAALVRSTRHTRHRRRTPFSLCMP